MEQETDNELLVNLLSKNRLEKYLLFTNNDISKSIELYDLNLKLSESLYTPLSYFEIFLRNTCNNKLKKELGDYWFDNKKVMKFLGIVLLTLCLNNSYIIVKQMINIRIPSSRVIRQAMKKNRGREIEIQLLNPHFTGTLFNLKDFDIKYKIKDKLSNANSLYSDKISYVDEKAK